MVGFTLPEIDQITTENIKDTSRDLNLYIGTDDRVHSSPFRYIATKGINKLFLGLYNADIGN